MYRGMNGSDQHGEEGRILHLEYPSMHVIGVYGGCAAFFQSRAPVWSVLLLTLAPMMLSSECLQWVATSGVANQCVGKGLCESCCRHIVALSFPVFFVLAHTVAHGVFPCPLRVFHTALNLYSWWR